jgi:hypothetical protein
MKNFLIITIVVASIVAGFSGCLPGRIGGQISSATDQPLPVNATFFILQGDKITLTERNIQGLIAKEMEKLGFKRAVDQSSADVAVLYSYSIGAGTTKVSVSSSPDFVFGGKTVSSSSSTEYPRYFHIAIIDRRRTLDPKEPVFIWQAELYSSGSSSNISLLAEGFIPELFKWYGKDVKNKRFTSPHP